MHLFTTMDTQLHQKLIDLGIGKADINRLEQLADTIQKKDDKRSNIADQAGIARILLNYHDIPQDKRVEFWSTYHDLIGSPKYASYPENLKK